MFYVLIINIGLLFKKKMSCLYVRITFFVRIWRTRFFYSGFQYYREFQNSCIPQLYFLHEWLIKHTYDSCLLLFYLNSNVSKFDPTSFLIFVSWLHVWIERVLKRNLHDSQGPEPTTFLIKPDFRFSTGKNKWLTKRKRIRVINRFLDHSSSVGCS